MELNKDYYSETEIADIKRILKMSQGNDRKFAVALFEEGSGKEFPAMFEQNLSTLLIDEGASYHGEAFVIENQRLARKHVSLE